MATKPFAILAAVPFLAANLAGQHAAPAPTAREAVERVLPLLQKSAQTWTLKARCFSCHHQGLGMLAIGVARDRGFKIDERLLGEEVEAIRSRQRPYAESVTWRLPFGSAGQDAMIMVDLWAAGHGPNRKNDFAAYLLRGKQSADGRWGSGGAPSRPPIASGGFGSTAFAVRALRLSAPGTQSTENEAAIRRAQKCLLEGQPTASADIADQLFGLAWAQASKKDIDRVRQRLLSEQRPDGGWAQIRTRESDAYATGLALAALNQAGGLSVDAPVFRRGIAWLIKTQASDGSWFVQKRRTYSPGLRYVESGFPYGEHQFISYAGSAWAMIALAISEKNQPSRALMGQPQQGGKDVAPDASYNEFTPLMRAALFGTAEEVRTLIANSVDVNKAATPLKLTPLMCAAPDAQKVKLLLDAGADVNAKSEYGQTALLIAARYQGSAASVKLLLAHGADPNVRSTQPSFFNGALHHAADRGNREAITALLSKGAVLNDLPGGSSAFIKTVLKGDASTAAFLLDRGARLDSTMSIGDRRKQSTPLMWAVAEGYVDVAKLLIDRGADVNARDELGWTPLIYAAATRDYGDTRIIEMLLSAGADVKAVTSAGESALDKADRYSKHLASAVLRAAASRRN